MPASAKSSSTASARPADLRTRLASAWTTRKVTFPKTVQLEITNACNFRCKMCPSNSPDADYDRPRTLLDFDLYAKIVSELATFPRVHIIPQGGGEPFLHPRFRDMLVLAKQHPSLSIGFVTNGARTKASDPELLVDLGIEEVCVSLYGWDDASHQETTGRRDFDKVWAFIEGVWAARQHRKTPWPKLRLQTVATKEIHGQLNRLIPYWLRHADEVAILAERDLTGRGFAQDTLFQTQPEPCQKLWREIAISSEGEVAICCEDWDASHPIGDLRYQSLEEIWFGEKLSTIRDAHRQREFSDLPLCDGCYMLWERAPKRVTRFGLSALESNATMLFRKD